MLLQIGCQLVISTANAKADPFAPPNGNRDPVKADSGSVVGRPLSSIAQPSGILLPCCAAAIIFPLAMILVDKSIITGISSPVRNPNAIGFVPKKDTLPPQGAIPEGELVRQYRQDFVRILVGNNNMQCQNDCCFSQQPQLRHFFGPFPFLLKALNN